MFDANLRHLPRGYTFFAKAYCAEDSDKLCKAGVKSDKIFLAKMLSKGNENPAILVNGVQITSNEILYDSTIIYAGNLDGTGFYNNFPEDRAAAFKLVGGKWEVL
jgi:hypothetical protein